MSTGFPGYNSIIGRGQGHDRPDPASTTATPPRGSARTTTRPRSRRARPARSTSGRSAWASSTSTASSAATPTSGSRNLFRNTTQIYPVRRQARSWNLITAMADDAIDYMKRMQRDRARTSRSSSTTRPAARTRRTTRRKEWIEKISTMQAVRRGLEQAARADLREPEEARRDPAGREADAVARRHAEEVGRAHRGREEALHAPGRGLRRLPRLHRPRDRPRDPGGRGHGQARQHADHLHQRRQRHERRGRADRHAERGGVRSTASRCRSPCSSSTSTTSGARTRPTTTWRPAGPGPSTRRSSGPSRSPRTSAARATAWRSSWPARIKDKGGIRNQFHHVIDVVPTILEAAGISRARDRRRHQAEADRGRELGLHLRQGQREGAVARTDAVLRDVRQPRHLPRRLVR